MKLPDLRNAEMICIDCETFDPHLLSLGPGVRTGGYIAGLAVGALWQNGEIDSWYFPIDHAQGVNLDKGKVLLWAREAFALRCPKVYANALYDLDYLAQAGVTVTGPHYDVQVAEPLIDENSRYSLGFLANKYLGETKDEEELYHYASCQFGGTATRTQQAGNIWRCPPEIVAPYARSDVELPLRIIQLQLKIIEEQGLQEVWKLETDLIPMLLGMLRRGVRVNYDGAREIYDDNREAIAAAEAQIDYYNDGPCEVSKPSQLKQLFDKLGLKPGETERGSDSFAENVLSDIDHPVAKEILKLRGLDKENRTFIDGYVFKHSVNNRIHPHFNQLKGEGFGTVTGRFSCSNPNLQNIPRSKKIRSLFLPEPGEEWVKNDYSSVEYRIAVHYSMHPLALKVKEAYHKDPDFDAHAMVAEMVGIDRYTAKIVSFGLIYGMGVKKLGEQLGISYSAAKNIRNLYKRRAPYFDKLLESAKLAADKRGYIKTILGRRRRFNLWEPAKWQEGKFAKLYNEALEEYGSNIRRAYTYKALNAGVQGSSADVLKKAMIDIYNSGVCDVTGVPLLTVHDELDFSVPKTKEGEEVKKEIKYLMENTFKLTVPLVVDQSSGASWGELE